MSHKPPYNTDAQYDAWFENATIEEIDEDNRRLDREIHQAQKQRDQDTAWEIVVWCIGLGILASIMAVVWWVM